METGIRFSNMSGRGVHEKAIEVSFPYLMEKNILVAGAGEGGLEYKLLRMGLDGRKITSVDSNTSRFKLPEMLCEYCDLNRNIPYADDSFDFCFAVEVIEHLYNPHNLLEEVYRVLKPHGMLLLTTPNVHSIMQKIRYLFSDRLGWFTEADYQGSGHIHPIFDWLLKRMIRGKFEITKYDSQSFHMRLIPKLPAMPVPLKHRLFAVNNIYLMKKITTSETEKRRIVREELKPRAPFRQS